MVENNGYKQTDLGVIPEQWEISTIGSLSKVTAGGTPSTLVPDYWNGDIRWMNSGELNQKRVFEVEGRITKMGLSNSATKLIPSKSVLIGLAGQGKTRGTVAMNMVDLCTNQSIAAILPDGNIVQEYLYHNLDGRYSELRGLSTGDGGRGGLNLTIIKNLLIALPPRKEQSAIAEALSDMDALIAQAEQLIEKKIAIKQGVKQELLKPKEGWVTKVLEEIGDISGAGVDKKIIDSEIPVRLVNYTDVYKRDFIYSKELWHWVTAPNQKAHHCQVKCGDVFFTPSSETREDIGLCAVAMEDIADAVYSYHLVRFRVKEEWDLKFRAYIFQTQHFMQQTETFCEGSGKRYVLTLPKFRSLKITYPVSLSEQKEISDKLWDIDCEIWDLQAKLKKLKNQKLGMMQSLLTGKIRLV